MGDAVIECQRWGRALLSDLTVATSGNRCRDPHRYGYDMCVAASAGRRYPALGLSSSALKVSPISAIATNNVLPWRPNMFVIAVGTAFPFRRGSIAIWPSLERK